ncbi:MAG: hypothetical protein IPQ07_21495 [Myxococcales bacterium]|nr:hypothetical protein [Myxococcales bacterium]
MPLRWGGAFVSLGYRELAADLFYLRLRGYYGNYYEATADGVASLAEAIVTLDPRYEYVYWYGASAMTIAYQGVDQSIFRRSVALLERGIAEFPESAKLPLLAAQTYIQDLKTDDPVQRRAWDERGALLAESAVRKPGATLDGAAWAATLRTKLGQRDRAIQGLRELLLTTSDTKGRQQLIERLAKLEETDSAEIAAELHEMRQAFEREWQANRPALRPSLYLLVGPRLPRAFDLTDLATGGHDLVALQGFERLEPLVDAAPTAPTPTTPAPATPAPATPAPATPAPATPTPP